MAANGGSSWRNKRNVAGDVRGILAAAA